ncbi:hypothetical protein [Candidatus Poriferisocius sp.]|uniref:hypothetical protein n=1 Tax=Candidatus Poriferisocius sp. TaxID=3101276 RepID=UPI003B5C98CA
MSVDAHPLGKLEDVICIIGEAAAVDWLMVGHSIPQEMQPVHPQFYIGSNLDSVVRGGMVRKQGG